MKTITFEELKAWMRTNKEALKGKNVRVTTPRKSVSFKTLGSLGNHILAIEERYETAKIYSYSTNGITFRNFSDDANEISNPEIKSIEITIGGGLTPQERLNLSRIKNAKLKNK